MTLYRKSKCDLHPSGCIEVRNDTFAWQGSGEEYRFPGVALVNGKWKTNALRWNEYYIMTSDQGIGILYTKYGFQVALVEKGEVVLVVNASKTETTQDGSSYKPTKRIPLGTKYMHLSFWHDIKTALETTEPPEYAQKILSAMKAWEEISYLTLLQAEDALKNQLNLPDAQEMFVAGHHWLWHNITRGIVIIGYKGKIWGSARLHSGEEVLASVALLPSGDWLVNTNSYEKYLVHWNGYDVEVKAFVFLSGLWRDHGLWRFWDTDLAILTPENRLVMAPRQFGLENTYPNWACFRNLKSQEHVLLINRCGKLLYLNLSEYTYKGVQKKAPMLYPGEQRMLLFHYDDHSRGCFSLVDISSVEDVERKPRLLWQVVADPYGILQVAFHPVYLKDEEEATEVFAFVFYRRYGSTRGVCLINERGEFWMPFLNIKDNTVTSSSIDDWDVFFVEYAGTGGATWHSKPGITVRASLPDIEPTLAVIRVSNGQGYVELRSGATLSGPFIPIPKGEEGLWPYLASALNL